MKERFKQIVQFIREQLDEVANGMINENRFLSEGGIYRLN